MEYRGERRVAVFWASCLTIVLIAATTTTAGMEYLGAHPDARPSQASSRSSDGFPSVDWQAWKRINPDVVGWITVPGADIDLPIVQAQANDPQHYLTHDVYGNLNFTGCPYLDWECEGLGGLLGCRNSIVFGHNMGWNADMFANLARYSDDGYAKQNQLVLVQTPTRKAKLRVDAVDVIPGWEGIKRIEFANDADFIQWKATRFDESDVQLASEPHGNEPLLTLCTCSYNYWDNERTLVYCTPLKE